VKSKKQVVISRYSVESKYRVLTDSTNTRCELVWIRDLSIELHFLPSIRKRLYCDIIWLFTLYKIRFFMSTPSILRWNVI